MHRCTIYDWKVNILQLLFMNSVWIVAALLSKTHENKNKKSQKTQTQNVNVESKPIQYVFNICLTVQAWTYNQVCWWTQAWIVFEIK